MNIMVKQTLLSLSIVLLVSVVTHLACYLCGLSFLINIYVTISDDFLPWNVISGSGGSPPAYMTAVYTLVVSAMACSALLNQFPSISVAPAVVLYLTLFFILVIYLSSTSRLFFQAVYEFSANDCWDSVSANSNGTGWDWFLIFVVFLLFFAIYFTFYSSLLPSLACLLDSFFASSYRGALLDLGVSLLSTNEIPVVHYILLSVSVGMFSGPDSFCSALDEILCLVDSNTTGSIGIFTALSGKYCAFLLWGPASYLGFFVVWDFLDFDGNYRFNDPVNSCYCEWTYSLLSIGMSYNDTKNCSFNEVVLAGNKAALIKSVEPDQWWLHYVHNSFDIQDLLSYAPPSTPQPSTILNSNEWPSSSSLLSLSSLLVVVGAFSGPAFFFCVLMVDEEAINELLNLSDCYPSWVGWWGCVFLLLIPFKIILYSWVILSLDKPLNVHKGRRARLSRVEKQLQTMGISINDAGEFSYEEVQVAYQNFLKINKIEPEKLSTVMNYGRFSIRGLLSYQVSDAPDAAGSSNPSKWSVPFNHFVDNVLKGVWKNARLNDNTVPGARVSSRYPTEWWMEIYHPINEWNPVPSIKSRLNNLNHVCSTLVSWSLLVIILYELLNFIMHLPFS